MVLWGALRWPIAFAGILSFFSIVYYMAPNRTTRSWRWVTPGAVVGSLLWLAISALFSLFTSFSSSYDRTYGALAGAIILLLWLNYSAVALLFGAELNAELERKGRPKASGDAERALQARGRVRAVAVEPGLQRQPPGEGALAGLRGRLVHAGAGEVEVVGRREVADDENGGACLERGDPHLGARARDGDPLARADRPGAQRGRRRRGGGLASWRAAGSRPTVKSPNIVVPCGSHWKW